MTDESSHSGTIAAKFRPWYLQMIQALGIKKNETFDICQIMHWFGENIFPGKTYKDYRRSVGRTLPIFTVNDPRRFGDTCPDDDLFFMKSEMWYHLYDQNNDPLPCKDREGIKYASRFPNESALRDYLSQNLHLIEPGLTLYNRDNISGIEYQAGSGRIDLLAIDKNNILVVIELKLAESKDKVMGQLLRYKGWVANNLSEANSYVRGMIIGYDVSPDLYLAASQVQNVELFKYSLSVKIQKVH